MLEMLCKVNDFVEKNISATDGRIVLKFYTNIANTYRFMLMI